MGATDGSIVRFDNRAEDRDDKILMDKKGMCLQARSVFRKKLGYSTVRNSDCSTASHP